MIIPLRDREQGTQAVDGRRLTPEEIRQGVITQAKILGSAGYFIEDEIQRCQANPNGIRAFLDFSGGEPGVLRVYYYAPAEVRVRAARRVRLD